LEILLFFFIKKERGVFLFVKIKKSCQQFPAKEEDVVRS
jgi:hypothetical protein